MADGKARKDNEFTVAQDVARALRTHIRVLARAITGLGKDCPPELAKALCAAVDTGARTDHATEEVGALAARFEANPHGNDKQDRPLANDLAAALRILPAADKDALLAAILKTNEPLILAQLHNLLPVTDREKLRARMDALGPEEVGETWSHNETQARINALLNAGVGPDAGALGPSERVVAGAPPPVAGSAPAASAPPAPPLSTVLLFAPELWRAQANALLYNEWGY